jgi:hypothetical protein
MLQHVRQALSWWCLSGRDLLLCLIVKTNMGWLWYRRLAHVGMRNFHIL